MAKLREVDVIYPHGGENRRGAYSNRKPPFTSPYAENVRSFDTLERRGRGGSRPPLKKWISDDMGASITAMEMLSYQDGSYDHKEALVVIVDGLFKMVHGSTVTTSTAYLETEAGTVITNEAASANLEASSSVDAANTVTDNGEYNVVQYNGKLYVAGDYCYKFSPNNGTVEAVENAPTGQPLVEVYRHRLLLGGADHIFGMSEEGDFTKWKYYDIERGAVRAVAGTPTDDGKLGGDMTCFKSWGSDAVIMASKDTIWVIRGNPNTNGRLDNVSREVGIIDQGAISITGNGQVVFLARSGLFTWHIGSNSAPEKFSENIVPEELRDIDTTANIVKMQYNEKERGIHLFITPTAASVGTHWFLDIEAKALWREKYAQTQQPLDVAVMPLSGDSNVLLGSKDGYIRRHDSSATNDDGTALNSHLLLGPFMLGGRGGHDGMIQKLWSDLASGSAAVTWALVTANSAEEAVDNAVTDIQAGTTTNVVATDAWAAGRNRYSYARSRGAYAVIWLSSASNWAYESMGFVKKMLGRLRV